MTTAPVLSAREVRRNARSRRFPRRTQFDYLHLVSVLGDLRDAIDAVPTPVNDVLDVYCGSRPYDDLLPEGARCVGYDREPFFGVADVVSEDFLPFPDQSFDLVMCIEAFHFVSRPVEGVAEMRRVLRPGATIILAVPLVWEYNREYLEHRYTGPQLAALFTEGWTDVSVVENGGRGIVWATQTGWWLWALSRLMERSAPTRWMRWSLFPLHLAINAIGALMERAERRLSSGPMTLPMNVLLHARRVDDAG